jgi:hypothetical protein
MRYYQIKYGFSKSDTETIEEKDLEKAIYAQIKKLPIQLNESYINGSNIIAIRPAYYKHTGWYDWYEPTGGEDWLQIKRDCPSYECLIERSKERVSFLMRNGQENQIGKNIPIPELEALEQGEFSDEVKNLTNKLKI